MVIGMDEAGKGDYFGPLVVAAVAGDAERLAAMGVVDSKKLTDKRAHVLAAQVRLHCEIEVVAIHPEKYNALYAKMKNLNTLLAWCHSTALENLLARVSVSEVILDQFANSNVMKKALKERGKAARLVQYPRAEAHPVVAAASIIARSEFLERLASLAKQYDVLLPKGAGAPVDDAGRVIVASNRPELLSQVAKLHFRTTQKIGAKV
jgi:ribonuclease HIII